MIDNPPVPRMKVGEKYRVKSTPDLRKYGVRTRGSWQARGDDRAWPGDVCTVVETKWTSPSGYPMSQITLEFERGRMVPLDGMSDDDKLSFAKVKAPKENPVRESEVPRAIKPELREAEQRAVAAGMREPYEFVGAGMTGVVFRAGDVAYKVARPGSYETIRQEADYLREAGKLSLPEGRVVHLIRYHDRLGVIEREYVEPDDTPRWKSEPTKWPLVKALIKALHGRWGAPEYKEDSFVTSGGETIMVDAGFAIRRGPVLVKHLRGILDGTINEPLDRAETIAWELRLDASDGFIDQEVADALTAEVADREAASKAEYARNRDGEFESSMAVLDRKDMTENPPWVDKLLDKHWSEIAAGLSDPAMLPITAEMGTRVKRRVVADGAEYGCGHYGCVMATSKPGIVCKATTDQSEAQLIQLAWERLGREKEDNGGSWPRGIVAYHQLVRIDETHRGRPVWVLWRDEAWDVGKVHAAVHEDPYDRRSLNTGIDRLSQFRDYAGAVRKSVTSKGQSAISPDALAAYERHYRENDPVYDSVVEALIDPPRHNDRNPWVDWYKRFGWKGAKLVAANLMACEVILEQWTSEPGLYAVATALQAFMEAGLLLADVHSGNIGRMTADSTSIQDWLITDPGHLVIIK